jgi:hypothetical protein
MQAIVAGVTGNIIYKYVIQPRKVDTNFAYLVAYGLILPFWIISPTIFIRFFDIRHLIFKFMICIIPIISLFRTTEGV